MSCKIHKVERPETIFFREIAASLRSSQRHQSLKHIYCFQAALTVIANAVSNLRVHFQIEIVPQKRLRALPLLPLLLV